MNIRGFEIDARNLLAIGTHFAILIYAFDSPRSALASIFFYFIFRILAVKAVLVLRRLKPTPAMEQKLYRFVRKARPGRRELNFSMGGCFHNMLVFGTIAYVMVWVSYLPVAPHNPDFADVGKGFVIFLIYDLKTLLGRELEIDFDADEETNYGYNMTPLASLIALVFFALPGIAVTKWLGVDWSWGLLVPLVVCIAILDIDARMHGFG